MTPRSKQYFTIRRSRKFGNSLIACMTPVFEAHQLIMEALKKLSKPTPRYPKGTNEKGYAIVGEVGPELIISESGKMHFTRSITRRELPISELIMPEIPTHLEFMIPIGIPDEHGDILMPNSIKQLPDYVTRLSEGKYSVDISKGPGGIVDLSGLFKQNNP